MIDIELANAVIGVALVFMLICGAYVLVLIYDRFDK